MPAHILTPDSDLMGRRSGGRALQRRIRPRARAQRCRWLLYFPRKVLRGHPGSSARDSSFSSLVEAKSPPVFKERRQLKVHRSFRTDLESRGALDGLAVGCQPVPRAGVATPGLGATAPSERGVLIFIANDFGKPTRPCSGLAENSLLVQPAQQRVVGKIPFPRVERGPRAWERAVSAMVKRQRAAPARGEDRSSCQSRKALPHSATTSIVSTTTSKRWLTGL